MSSLRNSSNNGTKTSSISSEKKKPSLPVRFIKWTMFQVVSFVLAVLILGIGYAAISGVWTDIPSGSGAAGQPVTATLMQNIINNINNLNGRLTAINPSGIDIVAGNIIATGKVCSGSGTGQICLDKQKGDPLYIRGIGPSYLATTGEAAGNYTGKYPTNLLATGILGKGLKQEWDEYGRAGCQAYKDTYGTWTNADVATCQTQYPGNGNTLTAIINKTISEASGINVMQYQILGGNPWIPQGCIQTTSVWICDGPTRCGSYPGRNNSAQPDFLYFNCMGK